VKTKIPLSYNPLPAQAIADKAQAYENQHHSQLVLDFETELKKESGVAYALAVNSGTAAIHLALKAVGVKAGDYVLVSTFTYVATISPITYLGAIPVFIDSETHTWNLDPQLVEDALKHFAAKGKLPAALLVVHTYGMPAKLDALLALASQYGVPLVEDAAECIGAFYNGKPLGSLGEVGILSFNQNKIVTTFGGGAVLTNNKTVYGLALHWAAHARVSHDYYHHEEVGFNYKMGSLNACAGLVSLANLQKVVNQRKAIFYQYTQVFKGNDAITWQHEYPTALSNRWLSSFVFPPQQAQRLRHLAAQQDIETRPLWKPMHLQPAFKGFAAFTTGVSETLFNNGLCLPSGKITEKQHQRIVKVIEQLP
jgi:dTDP-4-amino-4,6-dideoxygalactose transaminase